MPTNAPDPQETMMRMITGQWIAKPVYVAAELGIADLLADGPMEIGQIARQCGAREDILVRLLRALAGVGVLQETSPGRFGLTPLGECLQSANMRAVALTLCSDWHDRAWSGLLDGVRTGRAPFERAMGMPAFDWLARNPDAAEAFHAANAWKAHNSLASLTEVYDFSRFTRIIDLGGGTGALLLAILERAPEARGLVADLPSVAAAANREIQARGLAERCSFTPCDLFQEAPAGGDLYLLSNILHDWDDAPAARILANCRAVMGAGARLLVIEHLLPEDGEFSVALLLDLEMFVMGGGKERTQAQYRGLLAGAGFKLSRVTPLHGGAWLMEAM